MLCLSIFNQQGHCNLGGILGTLNAINPSRALWFNLYMLFET